MSAVKEAQSWMTDVDEPCDSHLSWDGQEGLCGARLIGVLAADDGPKCTECARLWEEWRLMVEGS